MFPSSPSLPLPLRWCQATRCASRKPDEQTRTRTHDGGCVFLVACASRVDAYACPGRVGGHDELRRAASGCACTCSGYDLYVAAACEPLIFMPMETRARSAVWRLTRGHDPVGPGTQRLEIKEILNGATERIRGRTHAWLHSLPALHWASTSTCRGTDTVREGHRVSRGTGPRLELALASTDEPD